jgi:ATP-binding cassette subfamily B protein/subfamily B ATP-binding cassette protein MsbA
MFIRQLYRVEILKKLSPFVHGAQKNILFLTFLSLLSIGISFATPVFYKLFVDEVIISRNIDMFIVVTAGYLTLFFISTAISYLRIYFGNVVQNRLLFKIKYRIMRNYLSIPFNEYGKRNAGDLKMRIDEDCSALSNFVEVQNVEYIKSLMTSAIAVVLMMWIEWKLALFSILVIPLTFFLDHKISLKEKKLQETNRINSENWYNWLQTSIQGWKEVRALNLQKRERRVFVRYAHNFAEYFGRWIYFWVIRVLIIPKIKDEFLMKFALYFFGGLLVMRKDITIGDLLVFSVYYELLSNSIRAVSSANAELQSNMPLYNRVLDELDPAGKPGQKTYIPVPEAGDLELRNVSFSYDAGRSFVVRNFSLKIKKGERVAIVGPSGSGKTTILKLIAGILEPDSGTILYSGIDIRQLNPKYYYKKFGFVMQENLLLNISIRENLLLANERADDSMLDKACKKACINDFVHSLPEKYDTLIGEKGVKLSGGQRQRLVLARLFLRDADILVFDEATSALDQYSESIIHDAIQALGRDKTILVVAHRESSIALCDRVIRIG